MTPLRKRMIRELELRRKATGTVTSYVKAVEELARYFRRSPDRISTEEIRDLRGIDITRCPPLRRTAGARGAFAAAIAVPLSSAQPELLGHLITSILQPAVSPDQPCSVARPRLVCINRDQTARGSGDSPFPGRPTPQPFPANSPSVHGVLPPHDDRSDTIRK